MKQQLLECVINMHKDSGEMVPVKLLQSHVRPLVKELEDEGKIVVLPDPFGVGDPFAGVKGESYPKDLQNLVAMRNLVRSGTSAEDARSAVECIII
jgi:hypothetical protein